MKQTHQLINTHTVLNILALVCIPIMIFVYSRPGHAKEAGPEHVIVTAVTGDVTYVRSSESTNPQAVMPFLKLEEGDRLNLSLDASINVLFIARGLGETWQGPKTLLVQGGELLSQSQGTWARKRPKLLKSLLFEPQKVLDQSALIRFISQPDGTPPPLPTPLPGFSEPDIQKTYTILRKEFGENDTTPDLYLLSVLFEYGQYDRMLPLFQDLLATHRSNPILLDLKKWIESRKNQ